MLCKKCSVELRKGAKFCDSCGTDIVDMNTNQLQMTNKVKKKRGCLSIFLIVFGGIFGLLLIIFIIAAINEAPSPQQTTARSTPQPTPSSVTHATESESDLPPEVIGTELKNLFVSYLNNGRDFERIQLQQSAPEELYDVVISLMIANQSRDEITANTELDSVTISYLIRVCNTFLEIFDTGEKSDRIREVVGYLEIISAYNEELDALIQKYRTDDGNLLTDDSRNIQLRSFYVQNAMGTTSDSAIERFLIDIGVFGNNTPSMFGATLDYMWSFGVQLPGTQRGVVQPIDAHRFPRAGVYTLNVMYGGQMEVVDMQGFRSFVPLYIEVSDEFVGDFTSDRLRFSAIGRYILSAERSVKNLLLGTPSQTPPTQILDGWINLGAISIPPNWNYDDWSGLEIWGEAIGGTIQMNLHWKSNDDIASLSADVLDMFTFVFNDGNSGLELHFNDSTDWVNGNWVLTFWHGGYDDLIRNNMEIIDKIARSLTFNP